MLLPSGTGLRGALVVLEQRVGYGTFDPDRADRAGKMSTGTDAAGKFEFNVIPAGTYTVTVMRTGYVQTRKVYRMQVGQDPQAPLSILMNPGVSGWLCKARVVDVGGKGVEGASIRLLRGQDGAAGKGTVTSALGHFEIRTDLGRFYVQIER